MPRAFWKAFFKKLSLFAHVYVVKGVGENRHTEPAEINLGVRFPGTGIRTVVSHHVGASN